jgi:hypothetical protein
VDLKEANILCFAFSIDKPLHTGVSYTAEKWQKTLTTYRFFHVSQFLNDFGRGAYFL